MKLAAQLEATQGVDAKGAKNQLMGNGALLTLMACGDAPQHQFGQTFRPKQRSSANALDAAQMTLPQTMRHAPFV